MNLPPNAVRKLTYLSPSSTKKYSAIDVIYGPVGYRVHANCWIDFYSEGRSCYRDFFYIHYIDDGKLVGAKYYCGTKRVKAISRRTKGRPVLVIAATGNKHAIRGEYTCYVYARQIGSINNSYRGNTRGSGRWIYGRRNSGNDRPSRSRRNFEHNNRSSHRVYTDRTSGDIATRDRHEKRNRTEPFPAPFEPFDLSIRIGIGIF